MEKNLSYKELTVQDMAENQQLQQWLETHRHKKGVHYTREGKRVYVLISGGARPTGGYKVIIDEAVMDSLDKAHISAHISVPKPGVMVIQKLSYPYACIQIEGEEIKDIQGTLME